MKGLILIAPSLGRMDFTRIPEPNVPSWIIQGEKDELITAEDVKAWSKTLTKCQRVIMLPEASHQFHGCLGEVRTNIEVILAP